MAGRHGGERGQTLVEFAVTLPVLFLVIFGIIDFGQALYAYDLVTSSARFGSRYAMVHGSGCTDSGCPATSAAIQTYVRSMIAGIDPSAVAVVTTWPGTVPSTAACAIGSPTPQCPVLVTVTYSFVFLFPLNTTVPIKSTSQMVILQ